MDNLDIFTAAERPEQVAQHADTVWPEFIFHDPFGERYWEALYTEFAEYQFALTFDGEVIGTGNSIPLCLEGEPEEGGWDWALEKGFADRQTGRKPNVLCGLQIGITSGNRGQGISARMIDAMRRIGRAHGFDRLILPIRPTLKHRYPLIPMSEYIGWKSGDLPFDPWIRAHARVGAKILGVCPRAMYIPGTVGEWESWTGLSLQSSGEYVFEGGLAPLRVDLQQGRAEYVEPNVWMEHRI